ncbi:hypothetical protein Rsub_09337 [Raphidocelis subcapitata]|uniref:Steroid 5-alpha reductase C-terminal domain-containing protein n=1 Tax=Raphidocelis subcapitata TaxID=307507 RepID=A0A2V0P9R8_9CHLO|nr:hypothetical protein Rsub_09337 [Raphidocelis subcapitata]|eukprot:GBF96591.1 hypothetical protein Rsub_09337 [Raphidocelis subcapitata]
MKREAALPSSASSRQATGHPLQDPRADPKDHIIRTHGRDAAGDLAFVALNLGLWAADAALFRPYWAPGPRALPNVRALLAFDLVRACRHCFWKLQIGTGIFTAPTAAFVALFNFATATAKLWLAARAGPGVPPEVMRAVLGLATAVFAAGSAIETGSELQRRAFKATAPGGLYTGGLFGAARNINYGGYVLWRLGMSLATCSPWALFFPAWHAWDFGARAVPMLEKYMQARYQGQWERYKEATPYRIFPGVW